MDRDALKLGRAKSGSVAIDPVPTGITRPPDTAIVAGVNYRWIGARDAYKVAIHVQRIIA